ncbi:hypothetical protein KY328_05055 [Candidatus Woesearchaeota archaeon]|nr:hypothetical protein [Candidatus Woesearchaeota archaeon]
MKAETVYKTQSVTVLPSEKRPLHGLSYEVTKAVIEGETKFFVAKKRDYLTIPKGFNPQETDANETTVIITGTDESRAKEIADILENETRLKEMIRARKAFELIKIEAGGAGYSNNDHIYKTKKQYDK